MNEQDKAKIRLEFIRLFDTWFDESDVERPILGENAAGLLADAALTVLEAIADSYDYLVENDFITE